MSNHVCITCLKDCDCLGLHMMTDCTGCSTCRTPEAIEAAFKAGYHCRWHREQGAYNFDPSMSPGDPDGAFAAWQQHVANGGERCGVVGYPSGDRLVCELPKGHETRMGSEYHRAGKRQWIGYLRDWSSK